MFAQNLVTQPRRPAAGRCLPCMLALFALLCCASVAQAEPGRFFVAEADTWRDEDGWYLNARSEITPSSGAQEALANGVPLVFDLQVQLVRTQKWLWDSVTTELRVTRQLQYHALSDSYIVRDMDSGAHGIYGRLSDALAALGLVEQLYLTDARLEDGAYKLRLRGSHDIESLPTPVRLLAYVSSEWDMSSEWFTWTLSR